MRVNVEKRRNYRVALTTKNASALPTREGSKNSGQYLSNEKVSVFSKRVASAPDTIHSPEPIDFPKSDATNPVVPSKCNALSPSKYVYMSETVDPTQPGSSTLSVAPIPVASTSALPSTKLRKRSMPIAGTASKERKNDGTPGASKKIRKMKGTGKRSNSNIDTGTGEPEKAETSSTRKKKPKKRKISMPCV